MPGSSGAVHPLRWNAQVTAGKDLYVSESTDLAMTGAQDAAGTSEAPAAPESAGRARRRGTGLSGMLLPELQRLAAELGISGTGRMRKGDLVAAISARQVGGSASAEAPTNGTAGSVTNGVADGVPAARGIAAEAAPLEAPVSGGANGGPLTGTAETSEVVRPQRTRRGASRPAGSPAPEAAAADAPAAEAPQTDDAGSATDGDRTDGDRQQRNRDRGG